MIRIMHAPIAALRQMCLRVPPQAIVIEPYTRFPLPWAGARAFLGELERRHGSEAIRHAVTPHRVLLSLVLAPLADDLTPAERQEREYHGAQELGCMSHSRMISQALFEAWLGVLQPLVTGCVPAIVVPDAVRMDVESVVLLRHLMRRLPSAVQPDLVLGHDPTQAPIDPLWRRTAELIETQLSTLACLPGCVVETLADDPSATRAAPAPAPTFCATLDDCREERVFEHLIASSVPSERMIREVLAAMRACFRAFGFAATLRLGLELLARCATLDHSAAAAVHALVALSAYNRKLEAGDAWLTEFLGQHFEVALALSRIRHAAAISCTVCASMRAAALVIWHALARWPTRPVRQRVTRRFRQVLLRTLRRGPTMDRPISTLVPTNLKQHMPSAHAPMPVCSRQRLWGEWHRRSCMPAVTSSSTTWGRSRCGAATLLSPRGGKQSLRRARLVSKSLCGSVDIGGR